MAKQIKFGLSEKEINNAIKQIDEYKKELTFKTKQLIKILVDQGKEIAKLKLKELGALDTGELVNSIDGFFDSTSNIGLIYTDCWYAIYVEFGTGVIGQKSPHPNTTEWEYDVNHHGEDGWIYFKDGNYFHTKGYKSRPFMYETAQELKKICSEVAKGVFES